MLIDLDPEGVGHIVAALGRGDPVVLPPPSPITYGVAGTDPGAVNRAKGRPTDQPVAVGLTRLAPVAACLDLDESSMALVEWLVFREWLTVLVPMRLGAPGWTAPATVDDTMLLAGAWLPETLPIVDSVEVLYLSSGNRTSGQAARTAEEADAVFAGQLPVLNGDSLRSPSLPHGATTMVELAGDGSLTLARHGINDRGFDQDDPSVFVADLAQRFSSR